MVFYTNVPSVITKKYKIKNIIKYLEDFDINPNSIIYELGSGWGDFSFAVEKFNPKKITGYELSPLHVTYSKLKAKLIKSKACFFRKDFFHENISDADIIYLFLVPKIVNKLWLKIKKECKPGTIVISLSDEIKSAILLKKIKTDPKKDNSSYFYFYQV